MASKRKHSALSNDGTPPTGTHAPSPPITHEPVSCAVKTGSDTSASLRVSKTVAPWISSSQSCLYEQCNCPPSVPHIPPTTLPPDGLPSPYTATEPVQQAVLAEPTTAEVSPSAALRLSQSSQPSLPQARTFSSSALLRPQSDISTVLTQAANDSIDTSVERQRFPLTKPNLRIFTRAAMGDNPVTPNRSAQSTGPGTMNSQKATDVQTIRMVLEANGMPLEDEDVKRQHPQVHQTAAAIINSERHSPVKEGWKENVSQKRNKYEDRNENTWIRMMWTALKNPERNVRKRDGEGSLLEPKAWESVAWEKSGLDENWDQLLHVGSLPELETDDENHLALIKSLPRVSTPKPDIAFGLEKKVFDKAQMLVNNQYHMYVQTSKGIYHPWFLVETKTSGTMQEVTIQCCRGGAAFVRCTRQLIQDSDPKAFDKQQGPDLHSMAFSLALVPDCANIYYHWAHKDSGGQLCYHMHFLKQFALRDEDSCVALMRAVNNILDWGLDARLTYIKGILHKIQTITAEKGAKKRKRSTVGAEARSSHKHGEEAEGEDQDKD
ncbi:hypothetical protein JMJ35_010603 [Cladonia borealis]|uniref:DUF7924 domain-containing protein n=1 Tax=Cladonia borealis TaxID=184061 RepID=A0AA39QSH7_9LECA|nr:hypothetical protein JMJ35_010603 [Cladonia borealis]